ncbi:hypothetical protein [Halalkalicoccus salilacus]|uniref:hypothetical protein n=1 Tax=Halalkalicoccus TaxID=332246 RepID=UPI002F96C1EB
MTELKYLWRAILREKKAKYIGKSPILTAIGSISAGIISTIISFRFNFTPTSDFYRLLIESQVVIISIAVAILSASISFSNYPSAKKYIIHKYRISIKIAILIIVSLVINLIFYFQNDILSGWVPAAISGPIGIPVSITFLSMCLIYLFHHQGLLLGTSQSLINSLGKISIADRKAEPKNIESANTATSIFYRTIKAAIQQDDVQVVDIGLSGFRTSTETIISAYARLSPESAVVDPEPRYLSLKINEFCECWEQIAKAADELDKDVFLYKITDHSVEICLTAIEEEIPTAEVRNQCFDSLFHNLKIAIASTNYAYRIFPNISYFRSPPYVLEWRMDELFDEAFKIEEERWQTALETEEQLIGLRKEIKDLENEIDEFEGNGRIEELKHQIKENRGLIKEMKENREEYLWGRHGEVTEEFVDRISELATSVQEDMHVRVRIGGRLISWMVKTINEPDDFDESRINQLIGKEEEKTKKALSASDYYHSLYSDIESSYLRYVENSLDNNRSAGVSIFLLIIFGEKAYKSGAKKVAVRIPNILIAMYYQYDLSVDYMSMILVLYGFITDSQLVIDSFESYMPPPSPVYSFTREPLYGGAPIWELQRKFESIEPPHDLERKEFGKDEVDELLSEFMNYIESDL